MRGATVYGVYDLYLPWYFNPRPPCGGRRGIVRSFVSPPAFQSTPPVRGATLCHSELSEAIEISIHAPRAGGDLLTSRALFSLGNAISIHAPRAGGDTYPRHDFRGILYFNPRPPCGGRPEAEATRSLIQAFQSTPPVRGATMTIPPSPWLPTAFQSTPPVRGATLLHRVSYPRCRISIHAPRAGGDGDEITPAQFQKISIHAPRAGGDRFFIFLFPFGYKISIHAPRAGGDEGIRS